MAGPLAAADAYAATADAGLLASVLPDGPLWIGAMFVLGLVVGSFLNVVVHRLPLMLDAAWRRDAAETEGRDWPPGPQAIADEPHLAPGWGLVRPRSHCPSCGTTLGIADLVPLLSWLVRRGRCAHCGAKVPARYPLLELAAGLLAAGCAWRFGPGFAALAATGCAWTLLALAAIDLDTQLLPDDLTLPLAWAGLLVNLGATFVPLEDAVIGAAAGYLSLWVVHHAFRLATGKEGMGHGDFKLLAALGAWFGWTALPFIVLASSAAGAVFGIAAIALKRLRRDVPIAFGPWLVAAGLLALFAGDRLSPLAVLP